MDVKVLCEVCQQPGGVPRRDSLMVTCDGCEALLNDATKNFRVKQHHRPKRRPDGRVGRIIRV